MEFVVFVLYSTSIYWKVEIKLQMGKGRLNCKICCMLVHFPEIWYYSCKGTMQLLHDVCYDFINNSVACIIEHKLSCTISVWYTTTCHHLGDLTVPKQQTNHLPLIVG
jgi:hypothetical protein